VVDYALATLDGPEGTGAAVVMNGRVHPLPGNPSMRSLLGDWDGALARIDDLVAGGELGEGVATGDARLLPPVPEPPNVYRAGANYADHAREMRGLGPDDEVPRSPEGPFMFQRPTTTLIGPTDRVVLHPGNLKVDWEVELALVIGRRARRVSVDDALAHVAGYFVMNDVSVRDKFKRGEGAEPPMTFDWLRQKGWEGSAPTGPAIVLARDVPDPGALVLRLTVNGAVEQESNTSEMLFSVAEQIAYISAIVPLVPGDVIATGTPAGVGMGKGRFLKPGDVVVAEVDGIGRLENEVVEG
jgi:2-keto-4-pentenoate hydratase/2-oxohepta-3-ene-1,7-dioic acid hydratase in catechol pathway